VSFGDKTEANIAKLREFARTQPNLVKPSRYLEEIDLDRGNYEGYIADLRQAFSISRDPYESALAAAAERGWSRGGKTGLLLEILKVEQAAYARGTGTPFSENPGADALARCSSSGPRLNRKV
jgi:hypothetical protein